MADPVSALLLSSAASAGGTAAAAGAAGTAAAAGAAASTFSMGTLLSLGLTGAGALAQISAGNQQSAMYKFQAKQSDMNAQLEGIRGRQEALQIKKERDQKLASINATYAARGGYVGSGTPAQALIESRKNAAESIDMAMFNSSMKQNQYSNQAASQIAEGKSAKSGGYTNALLTIGQSKVAQSLLDF